MGKRVYYMVNCTAGAAALLFLGLMLRSLLRLPGPLQPLGGGQFLALSALCTGAVYLLKGLRLYLILMEKRIHLKRFLHIYPKTVLVLLALPYKTGELFRVYCYGQETGEPHSGFLSVLVDRYFDTVPLLAVLLAYQLSEPGGVLTLSWVLLVFLLGATVAYLIFPSLYQYFNRFLIMRVSSANGLAALAALEMLSRWHSYTRQLVRGRGTLLLTLSAGAWVFEYAALYCLSAFLGGAFGMQGFALYLNHIFSGAADSLELCYILESAVLMAGIALAVYGAGALRRIWAAGRRPAGGGAE